ncbi:hypothetical protein F5Y01DRAFT_300523 [Xylaria sp. FL0043]|nr:hypothetical protein F5Y01DRAFT_300523 [Xylaria sp. FL0043]
METSGMRKRSPRIFYRVYDEGSQARMTKSGIWAAGQVKVDFGKSSFRLMRCLEEHLEWLSRKASPFVSVYSNERAAFREAGRRRENGKKHVTITCINTRRIGYGRVQYRNVRRLAEELDVKIAKKAEHNSKYEYVFLYHIPREVITCVRKYDSRCRRWRRVHSAY